MADLSCAKRDFSGNILLPASKSISNRLLILQELSGGRLHLENLSTADDTRLMQQCLQVYRQRDHLFTENAGTVMRFLTALLAVSEGKWLLEGSERMNQRPVGPLVDALQELGAHIHYSGERGFPPLSIEGRVLEGGSLTLDASTSSQYISALLMVAPRFKNALRLELTGKVVSAPYIDMTLALMQRCQIPVEKRENIITVSPSEYQPAGFTIEHDWSSAAFFYALAALSETASFFLPGLTKDSIQGDAILQSWFEPLGVRTTFLPGGVRLTRTSRQCDHLELDFSGHPDLFLPMAVACAGCNIRFSATGLHNLIYKESDRLSGAVQGLTALGFAVHFTESSFILEPGKPWVGASATPVIAVCGDHRTAMSFALLATRFPKIRLDETDVASKSFPGYFSALDSLGFRIEGK